MNFVASPTTIGRMPVAKGSKIPKIPAFFIFVLFLKIASILLEVRNFSLSIKKTPFITSKLS